jgi:hypothetical protein
MEDENLCHTLNTTLNGIPTKETVHAAALPQHYLLPNIPESLHCHSSSSIPSPILVSIRLPTEPRSSPTRVTAQFVAFSESPSSAVLLGVQRLLLLIYSPSMRERDLMAVANGQSTEEDMALRPGTPWN